MVKSGKLWSSQVRLSQVRTGHVRSDKLIQVKSGRVQLGKVESVQNFLDPSFFGAKILDPNFFLTQHSFWPNTFWDP